MEFEHKICVITGGAGGIGRCTSLEFLKEGASVCIIERNEEFIAKFRGICEEEGISESRYFLYPGDIADKKTLELFSEEVLSRFGAVDILVNNACFGKRGILSECSYEEFEYVQKIGVTAPYYLSLLFKKHFRPGASVINLSSTRAFMSQADTESYSAAKGGITALTHALSASLAGTARVNAIAPGWIDTGAYHHQDHYSPDYQKGDVLQHPAGRVGTPMDIASLILFLCSDKAGFITGQTIVADGGMTKLMIYHGDEGWSYHPDSF